jgi:hypothetical protein
MGQHVTAPYTASKENQSQRTAQHIGSPRRGAEEISVTCYSGFRINERPVKFKYGGKDFSIKKILDSSVTESLEDRTRKYYFHVLCETGEQLRIFFDPGEDRWFLL